MYITPRIRLTKKNIQCSDNLPVFPGYQGSAMTRSSGCEVIEAINSSVTEGLNNKYTGVRW